MKYYVVDAFADAVFQGNPAGVCLVEGELDTAAMQRIAAENNLSETAFVTAGDGFYGLRWFTPKVEVDLCGHATLASAHVITRFVDPQAEALAFETQSGRLTVRKADGLLELDFPVRQPKQVAVTGPMAEAIGVPVLEAQACLGHLLLLVESESQVQALMPDFGRLAQLADHAVIVTARGESADFVSRFFAPNLGVPEDPVTGSAHTILMPYWAQKTGQDTMTARQLSARGGRLHCRLCGERVKIAGNAVLYLQGTLAI